MWLEREQSGIERKRENERGRGRYRANVRVRGREKEREGERERRTDGRTGEPRATNAAYTRRARPTIRKNICMSDGDEREKERARERKIYRDATTRQRGGTERGNPQAKNNV